MVRQKSAVTLRGSSQVLTRTLELFKMMKAARNTKFLKRISGVVIALATLVFTPGLLAQTVTGTITGNVTDASGAVVSGAKVVAHNTNTSVDSTVTTNAV